MNQNCDSFKFGSYFCDDLCDLRHPVHYIYPVQRPMMLVYICGEPRYVFRDKDGIFKVVDRDALSPEFLDGAQEGFCCRLGSESALLQLKRSEQWPEVLSFFGIRK